MSIYHNARVLVTGACGTVGSELIEQLATQGEYTIQEVIGVDNNEEGVFFLSQKYLKNNHINICYCDIKDVHELARHMVDVDIVFHAAAMKHVVIGETSPNQVVATNIIGVQNVILAANQCGVSRVIFTSSDKAVNPTNVMGTSKLMGERLITAANSSRSKQGPIFASTRFGNVLGSSGSVVPIFHNQIAKGGPVTVTDLKMSRFVMSISEAVGMLLETAGLARGGEVFVTKMPVVRISDLATAMIEKLAPVYGYTPDKIEISVIGSKPGEKLYEELLSDEETRRSLELENYFCVLPAFIGLYSGEKYKYSSIVSDVVEECYISSNEEPISIPQIADILQRSNLFQTPSESTDKRYWPGEKG